MAVLPLTSQSQSRYSVPRETNPINISTDYRVLTSAQPPLLLEHSLSLALFLSRLNYISATGMRSNKTLYLIN